MSSYSIIHRSQLEGAKRLDAEYYQPEYLEFSKNLSKIGEVPLGKIAFITDGQHGYHIVDPESDIRHITAKNVVSWMVNDTDTDRLAKETNDKNTRSILEENDLLISTAGTIGEVGLVTKKILPANIDQDVARIHILDQSRVNPYFVVAFLNSKYGQFQLARQTTGQIQTHISLDKLKQEVFVPMPAWQGDIAEIVKKTLLNFEEAEKDYSQAEQTLLKELGLEDFEEDDELWNIAQLSDVKAANRMDAEYFQPKYEELMEHIKNRKYTTLDEMAVFVGHATQAPYDEGGSIAVLAQKHMKRSLQIDVDGFDNFTTDDSIKKNDKKYILKKGDVLISSAGEPGLTSVWIGESRIKVIPGSFVTVARLKDGTDPLYIGVFLNTIAGRLQFERDYTGSVQQYVYPSKIKNILIPTLPETAQQKIAELVRASHAARAKAHELLEEAKRTVEEWVEKGTT